MEHRFAREARLGASLNHPRLVAIFDTLTDAEGVLIVMEYVEGESLAAALRRGPSTRTGDRRSRASSATPSTTPTDTGSCTVT